MLSTLFQWKRFRLLAMSVAVVLLCALLARVIGPSINRNIEPSVSIESQGELRKKLYADNIFPMQGAEGPRDTQIFEAKTLLREYSEDEDAAREKYGGTIWLRGLATEISGPEVTLEGPAGVKCAYVSSDAQDYIRIAMARNLPITIQGGFLPLKPLRLFRPPS